MSLTFEAELTLDSYLIATFQTESLGQVVAKQYNGSARTEVVFSNRHPSGNSREICKIDIDYRVTCHKTNFVEISTCIALLSLPGHSLKSNWTKR